MLCYFPSNFDYRPFTKVIFPEFTVSWQFHSGAPPIPGKPKVSDPYELSPNKKEFSDRESMLYTIGVGAFTALLSAGPGIYDNHPFIGGAFTLAGLAGLIGLGLLLIWYRIKIIHALVAALVAAGVVLSYVIWTKPKEVIVHDPPTTEDIEKATALIRKELAAKTQELTTVVTDRDAEKQRADSATQQLATYQTKVPTLQSNLSSATNERDNLRKSLEETTSLLNTTRAQLGPKSPLLGLDDAKRWNIVTTMSPLTKSGPCIAAVASTDDSRSLKVFDELRVPLGDAGWVLGQASKSFFPPGITIFYGATRGHDRECALQLKDLLDSLKIDPVTMTLQEDSQELTQCKCIEIVLGKLDRP